jgi:hypothetical protein
VQNREDNDLGSGIYDIGSFFSGMGCCISTFDYLKVECEPIFIVCEIRDTFLENVLEIPMGVENLGDNAKNY